VNTRRALRIVAVVVASLVASELCLRALLFAPMFDGTTLAERVRRPELFCGPREGDLHWLLAARWSKEAPVGDLRDEHLGWVRGDVHAPNYDHDDRSRVAGRRPVLLYGDSYAQGNTEAVDCFQQQLELHPLGETHRILNYGVGGYGLDQAFLAMRASLDAWSAERPLVLIGILVNDDLDRALLSMRDAPKPRLELLDGQLVVPARPVPTWQERLEDWPFVASYGWLWLRHKLGPVESEERRDATQRLARALLEAFERELGSRAIPHAYVLFHAHSATIDPAILGWRDGFLRAELERLGATFVVAREELLAATHDQPGALGACFGTEGALRGHYTARGNELALRSLARAIARLEGVETPPPPPFLLSHPDETRVGEGAVARYAWSLQSPPFQLPLEATRLELVPAESGATLAYRLDGRASSFRARVRHLRLPREKADCGRVRLRALVDGVVQAEVLLEAASEPSWLELDLRGAARLELVADDAGDGSACDRIVLGAPRLR
jgi:hypothetical protein